MLVWDALQGAPNIFTIAGAGRSRPEQAWAATRAVPTMVNGRNAP